MTDIERLREYLHQMERAAEQALQFTAAMEFDAFQLDAKTQMAVAMALVLLGEAASRITARFPNFASDHPEIAWIKIRGMRNAVAHDYEKLDLDILWRTLRDELPALIERLALLRANHFQGE